MACRAHRGYPHAPAAVATKVEALYLELASARARVLSLQSGRNEQPEKDYRRRPAEQTEQDSAPGMGGRSKVIRSSPRSSGASLAPRPVSGVL